MRNSNKLFSAGAVLLALLLVSISWAQENLSITVTNSGMGLVRELRSLDLQKGVSTVYLEDIPSKIEPTSLLIESSKKSFVVLEQNYEYDLIDVSKVLNKSLGQEVTIVHPDLGTVIGKLLSAGGSNLMLLDMDDNLQIIPRSDQLKIYFKEYSKNKDSFVLRPTLVWKVQSTASGRQKAHISYLSRGLDWQADYVARLNEDDTRMTLACWVSVNNTSGRSYKNARLKLMAGDINVLSRYRSKSTERAMPTMVMAADKSFEEKAFFEYHLYTLQRPTDLKNNQVKQIQLFPETDSRIKKIYRVESPRWADVNVLVQFHNKKENNLGIPLPAGTIRLYKSDGDELEFIGENRVKHTPKNEKLEIPVGKAFDLVSERKVVKTERPDKRSRKQLVEYTLRNHKETDVEIEVIETVSSRQEIRVLSSNFKAITDKAGQIRFIVPVKKDSQATLKFEYITKW